MHNIIKNKAAALGLVGIIVLSVASIGRALSKIKETARIVGVGTLYGAIFAALFLAPFPLNQSIGQSSSDCPLIHFVITPGYGSDHDNGGFLGYIRYEDYEDFLKCLRQAETITKTHSSKRTTTRKIAQKTALFTPLAGAWGALLLELLR